MGAALAEPGLVASLAAYEPPMPWLPDEHPANPAGGAALPSSEDADSMVESFFRRQAGDSTWEGLADAARADRLADGPALMTELRSLRTAARLRRDAARHACALRCGRASAATPVTTPGHEWLLEHVPGAEGVVIEPAGHGAHLTHPDAFALFVRRAVERAGAAGAP